MYASAAVFEVSSLSTCDACLTHRVRVQFVPLIEVTLYVVAPELRSLRLELLCVLCVVRQLSAQVTPPERGCRIGVAVALCHVLRQENIIISNTMKSTSDRHRCNKLQDRY